MKFSTVAVTVAAAASVAVAMPAEKRSNGITDTLVLQYALTLENLENTFYHDALAKFDAKAFHDAGFPDWVRGRIEQIACHEATHVELLSNILGKDAPKPCTYKFPYTDPKSFVALATILENVGTSAYLGAAAFIENKDYLTAAGAIVTTEARHQSWLSASALGGDPWSGPFDTPLDFNEVFTLASQFIVSCPPTNPALPFKPFPSLEIDCAENPSGKKVGLIYGDQCPAEKKKEEHKEWEHKEGEKKGEEKEHKEGEKKGEEKEHKEGEKKGEEKKKEGEEKEHKEGEKKGEEKKPEEHKEGEKKGEEKKKEVEKKPEENKPKIQSRDEQKEEHKDEHKGKTEGCCLIIFSGLEKFAYPIEPDCTVEFPKTLQGIAYGIVSSTCDVAKVNDSNTLAGPVVIDIPFGPNVGNSAFNGK